MALLDPYKRKSLFTAQMNQTYRSQNETVGNQTLKL